MQPSLQIKIAAHRLTIGEIEQVCDLAVDEGLQLLDQAVRTPFGMLDGKSAVPGERSGVQEVGHTMLERGCIAQEVLYAERIFGGDLADYDRLYSRLLALACADGITVSLARREEQPRRLVCFDLDSTLIRSELLNELAVHAGIGEQMTRLTAQTMQGDLDFRSSFLGRVAMLKGLPLGLLEEIASQLPFTQGAAATVAELRRRGFRTAVVTGGFSLFARRVQQQLGIDYCYSTDVEIVQGRLTGRCVGPVVDEWGKAAAIAEMCRREGLGLRQTVVVGDGANDIPMLALAGQGITFHAAPRDPTRAMSLDGLLPLIL